MKILHQTKKLNDLVKLKDKIHLNPSWQRGPVWTLEKQALLIDSILRGYDIPMIYLRKCKASSPYSYEVIDGQQRLRSLWHYMDGAYTLPDDYEKVGKHVIAGKSFNDLSANQRKVMREFKVVVAIVKGAREPEVSRLFSRMQMGVRLNPAELRNAVQKGLRHAIDGVARTHPFFKNSRISAARYKYQDYLAHGISVCLHKGKKDLKAHQLMEDYNEVTDSKIYSPLLADAHDILTFLDKVNRYASKKITQKWTFVDLYFLLDQHKKILNRIDPKRLAAVYEEFNASRLKHNDDPKVLLIGKPSAKNRSLYDYILAFKYSGGTRKNISIRAKAFRFHFKSVLRK